mgnify:CR=1 FL=1
MKIIKCRLCNKIARSVDKDWGDITCCRECNLIAEPLLALIKSPGEIEAMKLSGELLAPSSFPHYISEDYRLLTTGGIVLRRKFKSKKEAKDFAISNVSNHPETNWEDIYTVIKL